MLKINLLPIRQLQKHAKARNELFGFVSIFILFLSVLGIVAMVQSTKATAIKSETARLNQEKHTYDKILAEIKKLAADKKEVERKIVIIKRLKKESSLTVHIIDEVARKLDSTRMWLTSLDQQGGSLTLTGKALDNKTIAEFMNALDASSFISDVNLSDSSLSKIAGQDLKAFSLQCAVGLTTKEADTTKKNK